MRRQAIQTAQRASSIFRTETSATQFQRTPYVCASCRNAAPRPSKQPVLPKRSLTTSPRRGQATAASEREAVARQTHYDFFPNTFPKGPPPNSPFTPDQRELRKEFLQLQAKSHPDLAPRERKRRAEALSARINEAYKTLQDPLKRAQYLLSSQGIDVEDESAKISDNALLMEVMEAREAVDEVEKEEELVAIRTANSQRIEQSVKMLEECFGRGDWEKAATEAIRLRYWANIEESIQGWEKGKGGGVIHH